MVVASTAVDGLPRHSARMATHDALLAFKDACSLLLWWIWALYCVRVVAGRLSLASCPSPLAESPEGRMHRWVGSVVDLAKSCGSSGTCWSPSL